MDRTAPAANYNKDMSYHEKINLAYDLERSIVESKQKLAELRSGRGNDSNEISRLEAYITKSERLLQTIQDDIHGIPAGRLQ